MTDILREQAQYRKGKTPIVRQYIADHSKLMDEIAGRGFSKCPGYAYDLENNLEIAAKLGLSDLNYKIISETIERELKQQGITYDLAYKTAAIAWEVEKQSLMAAWDEELANIKQGMAEEEEDKARLELEVKERESILITGKTAIEIERETYRLQLVNLEDDTAAYEVSLANAKLLTAQKKLELIPILQEICTKETELLGKETEKATALTSLIVAKQENATKKLLLVPGFEELANLTTIYAGLIPGMIATEEQIAEEKLAQATAQVEKSENELSELDINIDTANLAVDIDTAKRNLQTTQFNNKQTLITTKIDNENEYQNALGDYYDTIITDDRATQDTINDNRETINDIKNQTAIDSATTITDEKIEASTSKSTAQIFLMTEKAKIEKTSTVTASLAHIIS